MSGACEVTVQWQLFEHASDQVIYKVKLLGLSTGDEKEPLLAAYDDAVVRLLDRERFRTSVRIPTRRASTSAVTPSRWR